MSKSTLLARVRQVEAVAWDVTQDWGNTIPMIGQADSDLAGLRLTAAGRMISTRTPEWRNWYTHQTQNLARFTPHVGSSPTSGTTSLISNDVHFLVTYTSFGSNRDFYFAERAREQDEIEARPETSAKEIKKIRLRRVVGG